VNVSKSVVIGAVGAMIAMVCVIAFLLGRESGRHHAQAAPAPAVASVPAVAAPPAADPWSPPAPAPPVVAPGELPASPFHVTTTPPAAAPAAPAAPRPAPPLSNNPDEAAQVHQYFLAVSEIQVGGAGDPNEFANKLITSSLSGDSSGFDSLIASSQDALTRVKALAVPAPCAAYHAKLVKMFEDTVAMMSSLDAALKTKNTDALTAILPQANALQSQTTGLESQAREIKQRYGI
jgi:hypothetical protein